MEHKEKTKQHHEKGTKQKDPILVDPITVTKVTNVRIIDPSFGFTLERINGKEFNCQLSVKITLSRNDDIAAIHESTVDILNTILHRSLDFLIPFVDPHFPTVQTTYQCSLTVTLTDPSGTPPHIDHHQGPVIYYLPQTLS